MNLNITIDPLVQPGISNSVSSWLNETGEWSSARYPGNSYESRLEVIVDTFENGWKVLPREPASQIYIGEVAIVRWSYQAQREFYLTNQFFDVTYQVGIQTAFASCLAYWISVKGTEEQRSQFDPVMGQQQEQFDWLEHSQPELISSWIDRSNSLSDHVAGLRKEHWRFPSLNPKLCRYGTWGPGARFPEGSGRE